MANVLNMVKSYLVTHGHDGLYSTCGDESCGCGVNDLAPCGEINEFCVAAKKVGGMFYPTEKGEGDAD